VKKEDRLYVKCLVYLGYPSTSSRKVATTAAFLNVTLPLSDHLACAAAAAVLGLT
jgi:hypothetical protein